MLYALKWASRPSDECGRYVPLVDSPPLKEDLVRGWAPRNPKFNKALWNMRTAEPSYAFCQESGGGGTPFITGL